MFSSVPCVTYVTIVIHQFSINLVMNSLLTFIVILDSQNKADVNNIWDFHDMYIFIAVFCFKYHGIWSGGNWYSKEIHCLFLQGEEWWQRQYVSHKHFYLIWRLHGVRSYITAVLTDRYGLTATSKMFTVISACGDAWPVVYNVLLNYKSVRQQ
jgi:hypothetical protein